MTAATSARGTVPPGTGGAASRILPVAGASVRPRAQDCPVQAPGTQIGLGGGLRRNVGSPDLIATGPWRPDGPHRGDLHEPADPGALGGGGHPHRASLVDGVLARGAAARTSAGREHQRVSPGQQHRDIIGRGRLQVTDDNFGADPLHIGDVDRVPDQPYGLVAALGQEALQQQRDLPVPARDHYTRAVGLLTGIIGRSGDVASGPYCDHQEPHGPPKAWQGQSRLQVPSLRQKRMFTPRVAMHKHAGWGDRSREGIALRSRRVGITGRRYPFVRTTCS